MFCKTKNGECYKLVEILKAYELALGQMINLDKSDIFFSHNTSEVDKAMTMSILNIHRILEKEHYLGLPLMVGRSKCMEFRTIKERMWSQIKGWGKNLLFKTGKQ